MTFSQIGLIFDIIGVLILFKFGLPSDFDPNKGVSFLVINSPEDGDPYVLKKNRKIKIIAYGGLVLIILGFLLQFIGTLYIRPLHLCWYEALHFA